MNWRRYAIPLLLNLSGSGVYKNYQEILKISKLPNNEIKKIQEEKLKKLLLHSYHNVPYYKKVLKEAEVIKNNEVDLSNFSNIKILTKDIIRNNMNDLISKDAKTRGIYENHTGGSTGEPLVFYQDKNYQNYNYANKLFYSHIHGKYLGDKEIKLWGSDRDVIENTIGLESKIKYFIFNRYFINSFKFSEKDINKSIIIINSKRPKLLWGYVNSLESLSDYILQKSIKVYNPEIIFSAAGTLYEEVRRKIEDAFPNSKVINVYGSRELGDMAVEEEPNKGLVMFEHTHFFEYLNKNKKQRSKRLIITALENYSMPFIRYDIGDLTYGFLKETGTLTNYRKIKNIIGRETSLIKLKDGGTVPPEFFIHMIGVYYNKGDINKFQVIQEDYLNLVVKYVTEKELPLSVKRQIEKPIQKVMGNNTKIKFIKVKEIRSKKSGKYEYVSSKV